MWDSARERMGKQAIGIIVQVDRDWSEGTGEVTVRFKGTAIEREGQCIRINNILHPDILLIMEPDYCKPRPTEYEVYDFDLLDGNWSSHEGGDGLWSLG